MESKYLSPKPRDLHNSRQLRPRNCSQRSSLSDAISKANGDVVSRKDEDGVVRMKVVVRKQDLKQFLQAMGNVGNSKKTPSLMPSSSSSSLSFEQRLGFLRKKQLLRAMQSRRRSWSPMLQSIPEEICA